MSAVVQMPPAFDASLRECCAQAVQQAVAVLAAKYEFDAEEATRELKLDELTADQVQRANDALSRMSLCNESPIEIVRGGVRQTLEEQAILNGEEQPSSGSGGLYL